MLTRRRRARMRRKYNAMRRRSQRLVVVIDKITGGSERVRPRGARWGSRHKSARRAAIACLLPLQGPLRMRLLGFLTRMGAHQLVRNLDHAEDLLGLPVRQAAPRLRLRMDVAGGVARGLVRLAFPRVMAARGALDVIEWLEFLRYAVAPQDVFERWLQVRALAEVA